ncbi:MAG TPA: carboxymuconolactone decarboxylase family protein [Pseudonocardiaceae bacterium]|jgi:alkylhydroperoxidase family enzyme|nr:carboxymuconolactone decarboxylase family protein [Pseudonocardiaceae bacterium]
MSTNRLPPGDPRPAGQAGDLEPRLLDLVKVRALQLNGCAYLGVSDRDAHTLDEGRRHLDAVEAWRADAGAFSERERVALAFTEEMVQADAVSEAVWTELARCFGDREIVGLVLAVATVDAWHRHDG